MVCIVKAIVFSSGHVQMWKLDHKEGWASKNWCFRTVVLEKTPFGQLMQRADSLKKTLMLGKIEGRRRRGQYRMRRLDGITDWMDISLSNLQEMEKGREAWHAAVHACMLSCFSCAWLFATPWTIIHQVLGILQARILEWVALPSSMWLQSQTWLSNWTTTTIQKGMWARELQKEGESKMRPTYLGDASQQHCKESLGQRTLKGSSGSESL